MQHGATILRKLGEHLVHGYTPHQTKDAGAIGRHRSAQLSDKAVGDTVVTRRASYRSTCRSNTSADGCSSQRAQKEQTDQRAPDYAPGGAGGGSHSRQVDRLMKLDGASS